MAKSQRFRKATSDRSGFDLKKITLVKDGGVMVSPEELDTPPPSKKSLGGEGDVSGEARDSDFTIANTAVPSGHDNPVTTITAAGGITPRPGNEPKTHPYMRVTGAAGGVDITADPQISAGKQGDVISLLCTDSSITLDDGTGLSMRGSTTFTMQSGDVITFFYSTSDTLWHETSRGKV